MTLSSNKTYISNFFQKSSDDTTVCTQSSTEDSEIQRKRKSETISENSNSNCDSDGSIEPSKKIKIVTPPIVNNSPTLESSSSIQNARTPRRSLRTNTQQTVKSETITNFFSSEKDDSLHDFQVSKVKSKPKINPKPSASSRRKPVSRKKQPDIRKCLQKPCTEETFNQLITDHCALDNIDPDQFQLALAISRSIAGDDAKSNSSDSCENPPVAGASDTIKRTLEKFSFKSRHGEVSDGDFTPFFGLKQAPTRPKKWKNRCTPLTRRKEEIQKEKIRNKVEEILLTNITRIPKAKKETECVAFEITSTALQKCFMPDQIIFSANAIEPNTTRCIEQYYTNNLVSPSKIQCGALLRDWDSIPGRDDLFDCIPISIRENKEAAEPIDTEVPIEESDIEMIESKKTSSDDPHGPPVGTSIDCAERTDFEKTVLIDNEDIQNKLDVINTQLQHSQALNTSSEIVQTVENGSEDNRRDFERSSSPDLFADCDMDDDNEDDSFNSYSSMCVEYGI